MSDNILQLNEFFVEGGNQKVSHVLLHITEPSTPEERNKGYFFAVCEISQAEARHINKLQGIIDEIENKYYELPEEADRSALEIVLEQINPESRAFITDKISLHCTVGVLRQPRVMFSCYGHPLLFLFYKTRHGTYRLMDLLEKNTNENNSQESAQLFSHLIEGNISSEDYLLVATPHVGNYFTHDRLQKIITSRPAEESAAHIERVLKDLKSDLSFGGLVIFAAQPLPAQETRSKSSPFTKGSSRRSLNTLFSNEERTASTLAPSLLSRLRNKIPSNRELLTEQATSPIANREIPPPPAAHIKAAHVYPHRSTTVAPKKSATSKLTVALVPLLQHGVALIKRVLWWIIVVFIAILQHIGQFIVAIFLISTNFRGKRRSIMDGWKRTIRSYRENFHHLPLTTKIIFIAAVFGALGFIGSIWYLHAAEQKRQATAHDNALIQTIKTKRDSAESALVYHNEATALTELTEAQTNLHALPCRTKLEKETCVALEDELQNLLSKIRKMVVVQPINLTTWNSSLPSDLLKIGSKLVAYSSASATLFSYDLLTHEQRTIEINPSSPGFLAGTVPKENDFALLMKQTTLLKVDPVDLSSKAMDIALPHEGAKVESLIMYNRRLYSLASSNDQIYKHDTIKTGFGVGKEWVKDASADLHDAGDFTIDGDIFVLKNNGQIIKLTAGVVQPFTVQGLDPILGNAGKIWTYNDITYLYILDSVNKRLIILNKDGTLNRQITAAEWQHPTGMVIDEPNNTGYILDQGKLYKINLK